MENVILIMAHDNVLQVRKLVEYFEGKCAIWIHFDKKTILSQNELSSLKSLPGVRNVFQKYKVHWGGYSIVKCQLFLLSLSLKEEGCRYVHLLSGQDYPTRSLNEFLTFFSSTDMEFIEGLHLPSPNVDNNTFQRLQHFFFFDFLTSITESQVSKMWDFADWQYKMHIKRRIPDQVKHLYLGSAWFSLTRKAVDALLCYTNEKPRLLHRYKYTFAPDEMYIHTAIRAINNRNLNIKCDNLRYINWAHSGDNHPSLLTKKNIGDLLSRNCFFCRKLAYPQSSELEKIIDKYLLKEQSFNVSKTGCWNQQSFKNYVFDKGLCNALIDFCKVEKIKDVIDMGCGSGWYVSQLRSARIPSMGYDGNIYIEELSSLFPEMEKWPCKSLDLTEKFEMDSSYELSLLISVGEYIPSIYEPTLWENLSLSTSRFLVVVWASEKTDKLMVNVQSEKDLISKAFHVGFHMNRLATYILRKNCCNEFYKSSLYVFEK